MTTKKVIFFFLLPLLVSFFLHAPVFKFDLIGYHVWRQTQTQTVIYNFSFSDNSIFHPQKFDLSNGTTALIYEFPLYQWLIAQVNNAFGYSVLHTRLISFGFFIFLLVGFYKLQVKFVSKQIALISNAFMCFSPLLYYYCINPLPDILALAFAVWALNFFFEFLASKKIIYFIFFSLLIMLAALVKLPYLLFGSVLLVYVYKQLKAKRSSEIIKIGFLFLLFLLPVIAWYIKAIPTWGKNPIAQGIFSNNKSLLQLLDFLQFHLISSAPELLTNYAACPLLVTGIYLFFKNRKSLSDTQHYFITLFVVCLLYFFSEINMIEKVHDYYLMPFIPLIFLVVTYGIKFYYTKPYKWIVTVLVCLVPLTAWLRIHERWDLNHPGFTKDYLTRQQQFQTIIPSTALCAIDYDDSRFISLYYLKRRGFSFYENEITTEKLKEVYKKGVRFLVTKNKAFPLSNYPGFTFTEVFSNDLKIYKLALN